MDERIQELALTFRAGEREAFVELVDALQDRFYRIAYRVVLDPDVALDVAQDAFVKLHDRIDRWDGESRFTSWAYRVVTNLAIDGLRRRKREQRAWEGRAAEQPEWLEDQSEDALLEDERLELVARVKQAIDQLPPGQRAIVALRHYEGFSLKEIAEIRGCALGTVKSTLHQAFRSLRHLLGAETLERAGQVTGKEAS
ncbi:MAG: RNA polymerase sigma factor [Planctomycetota bacterium]